MRTGAVSVQLPRAFGIGFGVSLQRMRKQTMHSIGLRHPLSKTISAFPLTHRRKDPNTGLSKTASHRIAEPTRVDLCGLLLDDHLVIDLLDTLDRAGDLDGLIDLHLILDEAAEQDIPLFCFDHNIRSLDVGIGQQSAFDLGGDDAVVDHRAD